MMYLPNMVAKPVQISLDGQLLRRIDADPEAKAHGRSAFIRSAVVLYLEAKRKKQVDREIRKAFKGKADEVSAEIEDLIGAQAWPKP
jgi:metal-responsive CopG/Arc/MetJ family transcriptional regulator